MLPAIGERVGERAGEFIDEQANRLIFAAFKETVNMILAIIFGHIPLYKATVPWTFSPL